MIDSENCSEIRPPCCRSLHATAVHEKSFLVFGGYDGTNRRNDLYRFNIETSQWTHIIPANTNGVVNSEEDPFVNVNQPSARDRHILVAYNDNLYVFGGYDGYNRVNDLYKYSI
mmetsp:Transcript_17216/g.12237  ORF Transcript_17216/g.12237 Transcript_17216/m.12237 type:complete len:114 (+) Transcript_17216:61-402(+)